MHNILPMFIADIYQYIVHVFKVTYTCHLSFAGVTDMAL